MNEMLRVFGAILALALLNAGGANALERTRAEGAIPPKEGVVSPLRPEAVPEAGRELKPGIPAGGRTAFHVTLPPELGTERAAQAPGTGPVPVAFHRDLPEGFQGDLSAWPEWTPLGAGEAITAATSVTSPGATDMMSGPSSMMTARADARSMPGMVIRSSTRSCHSSSPSPSTVS